MEGGGAQRRAARGAARAICSEEERIESIADGGGSLNLRTCGQAAP